MSRKRDPARRIRERYESFPGAVSGRLVRRLARRFDLGGVRLPLLAELLRRWSAATGSGWGPWADLPYLHLWWRPAPSPPFDGLRSDNGPRTAPSQRLRPTAASEKPPVAGRVGGGAVAGSRSAGPARAVAVARRRAVAEPPDRAAAPRSARPLPAAAAPVACAPVTAVPSDTAVPPAPPPTSPPPAGAETADAAVKISVTTSGTPDAETPVLLAAAPPPAPSAGPGSPPAETTEAAVKVSTATPGTPDPTTPVLLAGEPADAAAKVSAATPPAETTEAAVKVSPAAPGTPDAATPVLLAAPPAAPGAPPAIPPVETTEAAVKVSAPTSPGETAEAAVEVSAATPPAEPAEAAVKVSPAAPGSPDAATPVLLAAPPASPGAPPAIPPAEPADAAVKVSAAIPPAEPADATVKVSAPVSPAGDAPVLLAAGPMPHTPEPKPGKEATGTTAVTVTTPPPRTFAPAAAPDPLTVVVPRTVIMPAIPSRGREAAEPPRSGSRGPGIRGPAIRGPAIRQRRVPGRSVIDRLTEPAAARSAPAPRSQPGGTESPDEASMVAAELPRRERTPTPTAVAFSRSGWAQLEPSANLGQDRRQPPRWAPENFPLPAMPLLRPAVPIRSGDAGGPSPASGAAAGEHRDDRSPAQRSDLRPSSPRPFPEAGGERRTDRRSPYRDPSRPLSRETVDALVDQVLHKLTRRLSVEGERRGRRPWL